MGRSSALDLRGSLPSLDPSFPEPCASVGQRKRQNLEKQSRLQVVYCSFYWPELSHMTPGGATRKRTKAVFPGRRGRSLVNTPWFRQSSPRLSRGMRMCVLLKPFAQNSSVQSSSLSLSCTLCFLFIFLAVPCGACRILGPWPEIKPVPCVVDSQILNCDS